MALADQRHFSYTFNPLLAGYLVATTDHARNSAAASMTGKMALRPE
jgi:hypothetical protein